MSCGTYRLKVTLLVQCMHLATLMYSVVCYDRPPRGKLMINDLFSSTRDSTAAQQVHISLAGENKMRISWMTKSKAPSVVLYGTSKGRFPYSARGTFKSYTYMRYKSGYFHHVVIGPLRPATVYFYKCGDLNSKNGVFITPPSRFPIKLAVAGDLGQTKWTRTTLQHISKSGYDVLLLPGDLSYAERVQRLWDTFGQLVEPYASQRPWMVAVGNHEPETIDKVHPEPFTAYNARWQMPFKESKSTSNLYYSFNVAGAHVIVLASYTDFSKTSTQYKWLESDLRSVNRKITPWIILVVHAPWYNSNTDHHDEPESVKMRTSMERIVKEARVDIVFAGHVHAYERFTRVYNNRADKCGPVHITIGDGGNWQGLSKEYIKPKPSISVFREASFGHGQLLIVNNTHARWEWHRNDDVQATVADSVFVNSLASNPACKKLKSF